MATNRLSDAKRAAAEFYVMHPPPFGAYSNHMVGVAIGVLARALYRSSSIVLCHEYKLVPEFVEGLRVLHVIPLNNVVNVRDGVEAGFSIGVMYNSSCYPTNWVCSLEITAEAAFYRHNAGVADFPKYSVRHEIAEVKIWQDGSMQKSGASPGDCISYASEYIRFAFGDKFRKSVYEIGEDNIDIDALMDVHDAFISSAELAASSVSCSYSFRLVGGLATR